IGVDRDQADEGDYKASNKEESNFVLTSTIKKVGQVVQDISNEQLEGKKFEGDQTKTYGLADGGIDITTSSLPDNIKEAVESAKQKIIDGDITVPDGLSD
nr:BMP family ABC transporter substrate-binding protein [Leuconostoc sp.]